MILKYAGFFEEAIRCSKEIEFNKGEVWTQLLQYYLNEKFDLKMKKYLYYKGIIND